LKTTKAKKTKSTKNKEEK